MFDLWTTPDPCPPVPCPCGSGALTRACCNPPRLEDLLDGPWATWIAPTEIREIIRTHVFQPAGLEPPTGDFPLPCPPGDDRPPP